MSTSDHDIERPLSKRQCTIFSRRLCLIEGFEERKEFEKAFSLAETIEGGLTKETFPNFSTFCRTEFLFNGQYKHHPLLYFVLSDGSLQQIESVLEGYRSAVDKYVEKMGSSAQHIISIAIDQNVNHDIIKLLLNKCTYDCSLPVKVCDDTIFRSCLKSDDPTYLQLYFDYCAKMYGDKYGDKSVGIGHEYLLTECIKADSSSCILKLCIDKKCKEGRQLRFLRPELCLAGQNLERAVFTQMFFNYSEKLFDIVTDIFNERAATGDHMISIQRSWVIDELSKMQKYPLLEIIQNGHKKESTDVTLRKMDKLIDFHVQYAKQPKYGKPAFYYAIKMGCHYKIIKRLLKFQRSYTKFSDETIKDICMSTSTYYANSSTSCLERTSSNQIEVLKLLYPDRVRYAFSFKCCIKDIFRTNASYTADMLRFFHENEPEILSPKYGEDLETVCHMAAHEQPFQKEVFDCIESLFLQERFVPGVFNKYSTLFLEQTSIGFTPLYYFLMRLGENSLSTYSDNKLVEAVGFFLKSNPYCAYGKNRYDDSFPLDGIQRKIEKLSSRSSSNRGIQKLFSVQKVITYVKYLYPDNKEHKWGRLHKGIILFIHRRFLELGYYHGVYMCVDRFYMKCQSECKEPSNIFPSEVYRDGYDDEDDGDTSNEDDGDTSNEGDAGPSEIDDDGNSDSDEIFSDAATGGPSDEGSFVGKSHELVDPGFEDLIDTDGIDNHAHADAKFEPIPIPRGCMPVFIRHFGYYFGTRSLSFFLKNNIDNCLDLDTTSVSYLLQLNPRNGLDEDTIIKEMKEDPASAKRKVKSYYGGSKCFPFQLLLSYGCGYEVVKTAYDCFPEVIEQEYVKNTALFSALVRYPKKVSIDVISFLLEKVSADVFQKNSHGWTPIILAFVRGSSMDIKEILIEKSCNETLLLTDYKERSVLHWAIYEHDHTEASTKLITLIMDRCPGLLMHQDSYGRSILHYALKARVSSSLVSSIIQRNPSIVKLADKEHDIIPLYYACDKFPDSIDVHIIVELLSQWPESANYRKKQRKGLSPLDLLLMRKDKDKTLQDLIDLFTHTECLCDSDDTTLSFQLGERIIKLFQEYDYKKGISLLKTKYSYLFKVVEDVEYAE